MPESSEPKRVGALPTRNFLDAIALVLKDHTVGDEEKMRLIICVTTNYVMDNPDLEIRIE